MSQRHGPRFLASFAAIAILLAGCGDGGDGGGGDATGADGAEQADQSPAEASDAAEVDPADQAIAEDALLTLQDFPAGWEAAPSDDDDDREGREEIAACVGVEYEELYGGTTAEASSPDFTSEHDEQVSVAVKVDPDESSMAHAFEIGARPEFRECMAENIAKAVDESLAESGEDAEIGDISINQMSFGSYGDETLAFRMTIPMTAQGFNIDVITEIAIVRIGRAQVNLTSFGVGSTISTSEFTEYVELAAARLEESLAAGS